MSESVPLLASQQSTQPECEYHWPESEFFVSQQHRLVYCPIQKVACSSLKLWWAELLEKGTDPFISAGENGETKIDHGRLNECFKLHHHSRQLGQRPLTGEDWFRFAIVRNPWSRLVSAFVNKFLWPHELAQQVFQAVHRRWKRKPWETTREMLLQAFLPFSASRGLRTTIWPLLRGTSAWRDELTFRHFIDFLVTQNLDWEVDLHWRPQYRFLGNVSFHFIGRFERLAADLRTISHLLGIRATLPVANATKYARRDEPGAGSFADVPLAQLRKLPCMPDYRNFYTPQLIEQVGLLYERDVEQFGYDFEG